MEVDEMGSRRSGDNQGHVKLDFVLRNIKGSMSCTDTPFNESSVVII